MSAEATTWALKKTVGHPTTKLILLILADVAGQEHSSWYGQKRLAEMAEISERSLRTHLTKLEELGLLTRVQRAASNGARTTDIYRLNVEAPPRKPASTPPGSPLPGPPEAGCQETVRVNRTNSLSRGRATSIPEGWAPNADHRARALKAGIDVEREAERFRSYCVANGRTYKNWAAAFTTWLMRAEEYAGKDAVKANGSESDLSIWED